MAGGKKPEEPGFAELIGEVRRLHHDTIEPVRRRPPPRRRAREPEAPLPDSYSEAADPALLDGDYHRPGVQRSILRRLRRSAWPPEATLDLHGLRAEQALARLDRFLAGAQSERLRCVRIVHGKGMSSPGFKPVLKPRVRHWLREDARVLAYVGAPPSDGGEGALYVLLRARGTAG